MRLKKLLIAACLGTTLGASAQVPTTIAHLRTLEDANYNPTDTNTVFQVTGTVTTYANMTASTSEEFYLQDATAGIAVFIPGADAPRPPAGANVTVTGRMNAFNALLELGYDVTVQTNSTGNPLPAPTPLDFGLGSAQLEAMEGSYVVASNVFIDQSSPSFPSTGSVMVTNEFNQTFVLFINSYVGIGGTPRPAGPVTIYGVLGQFDSSDPRDSGYELTPSRPADIVSLNPPPLVIFTNVLSHLARPGDAVTNSAFTEYVLRPGETLTIDATAYDQDGSNVTIFPSTTAPGGSWSYSAATGTNVPASFTYTASSGDAGNAYQAVLEARTSRGTNLMTWSLYVPTAEEQNIVISEFLANPTTDTNSPFFNPLHRPFPGSTNAFADDEFVEIVNLNSTPLDFIGWSLYDAVSLRHEFYDTFSVSASNTAVLYGGMKNNDPAPPAIPGASAAFSEGVVGVSVLNDGGDTIRLYNLAGQLVARVVYTKATSANGISWTRYPTLTNDFVDHASVVATNASPGLQPDQRAYDQPVIFAAPPTVSAIANRTVSQNTSTGPIPFTVGDPATPAASLTLSGRSSNVGLVPNGNIIFGGSGSNRTVTVTPATGQSGVATITVTVGNANLRAANTNLLLTVTSTNAPVALFHDGFSYADGSIITNSGFVWTNHSGTVGQMQVLGGKLQVTFAQSEDVNVLIPGQPYLPGSGPLYCSFTANFSALPSSAGSYFAHFKDSSTGFKARVWAETLNAPSGQFRLAIANTSTSGTEVQFPQDLDLNTTHRVVVKYDMASGVSTLWIDPATEASASVVTTDGAAAATVTSFAFRQNSGIGTMQVDDLSIGTSFAAVVPLAAIPLTINRSGNDVVVSWANPAFSLLTGTNLAQVTNRVAGATSPYTNALTGGQKFFRLVSP